MTEDRGFDRIRDVYTSGANHHFQEIVVVNIGSNQYKLIYRKSGWGEAPDVFDDYSGTMKGFAEVNVEPADRLRYEEFMTTDHWRERASRSDYQMFSECFRLRNSEDEKFEWYRVEVSCNADDNMYFMVFFRRVQDATDLAMLNNWYAHGSGAQVDVDYLTKLMNRSGLDESLNRYMEEHRNEPGVLLAVDIDDFKMVNDVYGHDAGDQALIYLAEQMRTTFSEESIIGRNGGDEFMVFLKNTTIHKVEPLIREFTDRKYELDACDKTMRFTLSAGVASYPYQASQLRELCRMADAALYSVKINHKHGYKIYDEDLKEEHRAQLGFNLSDMSAGIPGSLLVYKADANGEILFANRDMVKLFECDDLDDFMEFTKGAFQNLVHPDDQLHVFQSIYEQIWGHENYGDAETIDDYVDFRIITKKGNIKEVEDIGRLVHSDYYGDIFYVFINEKHRRPINISRAEQDQRNQEIIEILASEYTSVYYIQMDDDGLIPYAMNEETESKFGNIFRSGIGYTEAFELYTRESVDAADRANMLRYGSLDHLKKALADRKTVEYTYLNSDDRYCIMRFVKFEEEAEAPHIIGLGFVERDADIRAEMEAEEEARRNQEVIGILASEYTSVYYIRMEEDGLVPYTMNEETENQFGNIFRSGIGYEEAFRLYAEGNIAESDRQQMIHYASLEDLKRELRYRKKIEYTYLNTEDHYCTMTFVKSEGEMDEPKILGLGFADRDAEIRLQMEGEAEAKRNQQVIEILASEYTSVYYIRMDDDGLVPYAMNEETESVFGNVFRSGIGYTDAFHLYTYENVDRSYQSAMIRYGSYDNLKRVLADRKTVEYTYLNSDNRYCIMRFVKFEDEHDEPHIIGLGFADRDADIRAEMEAEEEARRNQEVIGILASEYTSVYYIRMRDGGLVPYTMNEETENQFGNIFRSGIGYEEAFRMYADQYIDSTYRDEMIVFASMDNLKNALQKRKKIEYTFLNTDDHYCTMTFVKSEGELDEPKIIGLGFADRDSEIRSRMVEEEIRKRNQEVIEILASEYRNVYYVNMDEDSIVPYALNDETEEKFGTIFRSGIRFTDAFHLFSYESIHPDYQAEIMEKCSLDNLKKALADRKTVEYMYLSTEDRYCIIRFVKFEDENEQPHIIGVGASDKDAEIRAQMAEEEERRRNQEVIEILASKYTSVHYIQLDTDGLVPYTMDEETDGIFGDRFGSDTGYIQAFEEYVHGYMAASNQERMLQAGSIDNLRKALRYRKSIEFTFLNHEDRYCVMRYVKSEGMNEEPHNIGLGFADRDEQIRKEIKRRKELEEALEQANAASNAKTSFLANMSHDLRTPMNAVIGFAGLAIDNIDDKTTVENYLKQINTSGRQLLDIINNILEITKIENKKVIVEEELTDTNQFYYSLLTVFTNEAKAKGIRMDLRSDTKHRYLYVDRTLKEEIILNIVSNAIKYTPEGGHIKVSFSERKSEDPESCIIRTVVEDDGIGMSDEFQKNLFNTFERERNSTVSGIQGTGLGLAIVKQLVELLGGQISIESKLGVGTKVTIDIPHRIGEEPAETEEEKMHEAEISLKGVNVLLAEDIDVNAMLATELLSAHGMIVDRARDGVEAVNMVLNSPDGRYDLVLMDIQMPNMNGYDASKKIREFDDPKKAGIPIIAMTANAFKEDQDRAEASGMNGHIAKPLEVTKMFETIREVLSMK